MFTLAARNPIKWKILSHELQDEETLSVNWWTITYIFSNSNFIFSTETENLILKIETHWYIFSKSLILPLLIALTSWKLKRWILPKIFYVGLNFTLISISVMYNYCQYKFALRLSSRPHWCQLKRQHELKHVFIHTWYITMKEYWNYFHFSPNSFYIHRGEVCSHPIFNTWPVIALNIRRQEFMSTIPSREKCLI